jgi:ABC-type transport system involved in multi-copper enzyme maturation permease subunit
MPGETVSAVGRPSTLRSFRILAAEALEDAVRRRVVAAIVAVSVLSLLGIDSCTSCAGGNLIVDGQPRALPQIAGATGLLTFSVLALWCMALATVLAAEHLVQTLDDGSASLCLARPVGRATFAFSRLAGALAIALVTGAVLLGATAGLLHARSGLPLRPALAGGLAFALGAVTIGAASMTLSLFLARIANVLLSFATIGVVALANGLSLAGRAPEGLLGLADRAGPPLASAVVLSLSPWVPELAFSADPVSVAFRALAWAVAALLALRLVFSRIDLGQKAP